MPSDIQLLAVAKAINFLKAAGAQYKVLLDGEVAGDTLPVPPAEPEKKKVSRIKKHDWVAAFDYVNVIKALQPGQECGWTRSEHPILADREAWWSFSSSVGSVAKKVFGEDNYIHHNVTGKSVTVLRVA